MNLRGSEIGRCHHYLAIKALGLPLEQPPGYLLKIFEAGNRQEGEAIERLEGEYPPQGRIDVIDRQREVKYNVGEHTITGHIDGIQTTSRPMLGLLSRGLLEIKAMSQERFARLWSGQLEPAIAMQVAAYCFALLQEGDKIEGFYVLGKLWEKDQYHSYIIDGDEFTSFLDTQQQKIDNTVEQVAQLVESIKARAEECDSLQKSVAKSGLPTKDCKECGARYHCYPKLLEEEKTMAEDFIVSDDVADIGALEKYKKGKELEVKGKKLVAEARVQFKRVLSESHPKKIVVEGVGTVSRVTTKRKKWNYGMIGELIPPDQLVECYEEIPSTSLRIALQKEE